MSNASIELSQRSRANAAAISRRRVIGGGVAALAGTASIGLGLGVGSSQEANSTESTPHAMDHGAATPDALGTLVPATPFNGMTGEALREPSVRMSDGGVLDTSLNVAIVPATIAGREVTTYTYDGEFPGPTLRLKPGETLRVSVSNGLNESTNLHTHGFHVSPKDNSDNIFVEIKPGETFDYEYRLPDNHPAGTYWYHPHQHGTSAVQTNGGLGGVIIVEGDLDALEGIAGLTERTLVLTASQFDGDDQLVPYTSQTMLQRFVNGQLEPVIPIQPGETQRWRIANVSSDTFFLIALQGHTLYEIASDGTPYDQVVPKNEILLAPAERTEVLVQASTKPGVYEFRTLLWGPDYQAQPDTLLATMNIAGDPVESAALPEKLIQFEDLRGLRVDETRVVVFEEPGAPLYLAIDGKHFDMNRVDQTVKLGALEEWIIRNTSSHFHPFHIHVNDFQVIAFNGEPVASRNWQDTVLLPPGSETVIRMRFADFDGKFVYHCHILEHEEFGMMAIVEVVP